MDWETKRIAPRPDYPPQPVGLAIEWPAEEPRYWAFGHPTGNNCDPDQAVAEVQRAYASGLPILFHNGKFDVEVSHEWCDVPILDWQRTHDTMFLAFLADPHARSLGLKELADDMLGWPATEQDELNDWIWQHRETLEQVYPQYGKVKKSELGAWIFATPAELAGKYAKGDLRRTKGLFDHLWPIVQDNGLNPAYDRERAVMPILLENERIGLRTDEERLNTDIASYSNDFTKVEDWLRSELKAPGINFDADIEVGETLFARNAVRPECWQRTEPSKNRPNGQLKVGKDALPPSAFFDPRIPSALGYRNRLKTAMEMFMKPWAAQAARRGGYISCNWNQTRSAEDRGTRTGRPSANNPNLLNIAKNFEGRASDGYLHPEFLGVANLPLCRGYILPDPGEVFLHRDFDGQELRVFAHHEQGALWQAYHDKPDLDPHSWLSAIILEVTALELERTRVKNVTFARLYGGGLGAIERQARCESRAEAQVIANAHDAALPGRKVLVEEIKRIVRRGEPIRTWGGRLYFPEPPGADGRDKSYKLIDYLCQGGAADITKQALIDWHAARGQSRFLVTVYDEIDITAPIGAVAEREMAILKDVMEVPRLSVPMRTTGKRGSNWGSLEKCA